MLLVPSSWLRWLFLLGGCGLTLCGSADAAGKRPVLLHRVEPVYPPAMEAEAEDGSVDVSFEVDEEGRPSDVTVRWASNPAFAEAVLAAVSEWKYEPATRKGRPVRSSRVKERIELRAPWNVKLGPMCGREVFVELSGPVVEEGELEDGLRLTGHWKPEGSWLKLGSEDRHVTMSFVLTSEGEIVNPAVEEGGEVAEEVFAAAYTLMHTRWDIPMRDGQPIHVRMRRTLTLPAGSRHWSLPDPVVDASAGESVEHEPAHTDLDRMPVPIKRPEPKFPRALRARGLRGSVDVAFVVTSRGDVTDAQIVRSTQPEFEAYVLAAVRRWKFEPGLKAGRPVNTRMQQTIAFDVR